MNWLACPICKGKTRTILRNDAVPINFLLLWPNCNRETLINADKLNIIVIKEPDV
ncbi:MAG: conjugal transfer protein [Oscillospiraceae bacterium]|nr:conjugal transfer protein [Oscillospiraceae bacterium]